MSKRSETTTGFRNDMYFAPITVAARCTEEEYVESKSSGNMMIHRTWEVAKQPELKVNGQEIDIIGNEVNQYLVCKSKGPNGWDETKSRKAQGRVFEDYQKLGLINDSPDAEIDFDNPPLGASGLVADVKIRCDEYGKTHPLTEDEAKAGKKVGEPKMGGDGKQEKGYKIGFAYIEGLHKGEVGPF